MKKREPLACYIYTESRKTENYFIENIRFGGGAVNNGLIHLGNPNLPFGGVGSSGMGMYHGKYGFDTFTHFKSIKRTPRWFDLPIIYPPYKDHVKWLRRLLK
jgi:aldehyde dehydrogenase (NAD+)